MTSRHRPPLPRLVCGALAGLAGVLAMTWAERLVGTLEIAWRGNDPAAARRATTGQSLHETFSTEAIVILLTSIVGIYPSDAERRTGGRVVHYAVGPILGALYAHASDVIPTLRSAHGVLFGAGVWLAANEVALPRLGLVPPPRSVPLAEHVASLVEHVVWGVTTDAMLRAGTPRRRMSSADRSVTTSERARRRRLAGDVHR